MNATNSVVDKKIYFLRCKFCGPIADERDRGLIRDMQPRHGTICPGPRTTVEGQS